MTRSSVDLSDDTNLYAGPFCQCGDYSCRANDDHHAPCDNSPWVDAEENLREAWMDEQQRAIDEEDLKADLAVVAQKQRAGQALTAFDRLVLECAEALG